MKENYSAVNMMILQEKGYFGHDDASLIVDGDPHFIINPISREIVNNSKKTDLIQFDHNSERITFECPHFIEGHDMTFCNKVVIDYSVGESKGVYEVNDLAVKENDSDTVVFTWLISSNVTTTLGKIKFALTFKCVLPDGTVTYKWGTKRNDTLQCLETEQGNAWVAYDYPDILEQWKTKIFDARDNSVKDIVSSTNNGVSKIVSEGKSQVQAINTAGITVKNDIEKKASDTLATIPENYTQLDSDVSVLKSENVRYSARFGNALIKKVTGDKSVIITDSAEAVFHDLKISGKSEQIITTGANLLDLNGFTKSGNATYYAVGSKITVIGSSSNDTITYFFPIENMGGKTYVLSCKTISNSESSADYSIAIGSVLGSTTYLTPMDKGNIQLKKTISESATQVGIFITPNNARGDAVALNTLTIECLMFIENDTTIPWEPYTGGASSPSPDYPQDIISTGTVSTGAQLFYKSLVTLQGTGAEADITDKRAIKITCTRANSGKYAGFIVDDKSNIIGKTLTISYGSVIPSKSGLTPGIRLYWIDNNGYVLSSVVYANKSPTTITIDDPQNDRVTKLALLLYADVGDVAVVNDYVIYKDIMINAGDTALPWEPYTGGKPSPSVEYPQALEVTATGAQLLDFEQCLKEWNSKYTQSNGRVYTVNALGVGFQNPISFSDEDIKVTLSGKVRDISGSRYRIELMDSSGNLVGRIDKDTKSITVMASKIRLNFTEGGSGEYSDIMLNTGDTALPWEPYRSASASITLTEPLRGIEEYRERIMCRDGVWGIECLFKEVILTGQENWATYGTSSSGKSRFYADDYIEYLKPEKNTKTPINMKSDRLLGKCSNDVYMCKEGISSSVNSRLYIYLEEFSSLDVDTFKTYLSTHPISVIFELNTPTWEPLPTATQQALNELTTYAGTTHLTITAGGPAAGIEAEYVQDINGVIADLLRQIEELRNAHTN